MRAKIADRMKKILLSGRVNVFTIGNGINNLNLKR
jgi:hypothetical protein